MSCNCNPTQKHQFPCPCDSFVHPQKLNIGAGLTDLPRQIASFPEFRRAMLYSLRPKWMDPPDPIDPTKEAPANLKKHSLDSWKAQQMDDLGIMLLEMWAYICDSLSFYDKVIAQEEYLRTAERRPSLRKLVGLTGYIPRPSVGSIVFLSALAEGRLKIKIPPGTAFRSSGFEGNPPQVSETEEDHWIHPLANRWTVKLPQPEFILENNPDHIYVLPKTEINPPVPLLIIDSDNNVITHALWVASSEMFTDMKGIRYRKIRFNTASRLPLHYPFKNIGLFIPLHSAGLWNMTAEGTPPSLSLEDHSLVMDSLYRHIKPGQYITISRTEDVRWFRVASITEVTRKMTIGEKVIINSIEYNTPGISIAVTRLVLDADINAEKRKNGSQIDWNDAVSSELIIHFTMQALGTIINKPKTTLGSGDPILFNENAEMPESGLEQSYFFLSDKNTRSIKINGKIDFENSSLIPAMNEDWSPELTSPVETFGNVIRATRGETVGREILGSGNASTVNQSFKLKKKPLTYFPAPSLASDFGVKNTLKVYVDGVRWTEVANFFNTHESDEIYIVRQDDQHDSIVTFGDGTRGRRLPTGLDNIIASYRFGAEQAVPPAHSITQISKGVNGLISVNNPLAAFGGADAESSEDLRTAAPKSILTLGRIVSIQDVEAVARAYPGVRAAQAEWRWHQEKQAPLIQLWYIGNVGLESTLEQRLRSMSDPSTIIHVDLATGLTSSLKIDIEVNPRYVHDDVVKSVKTAFMDVKIGLLPPERLGIGKPLFRSQIFETALDIPGVLSVKSILFNESPLSVFGKPPGVGKYFDFESGTFECQ